MKAIISITQNVQGESVHMLGAGQDEAQARRAAFEWVNHGHNPYDEEYSGGTLVDVGDELADLYRRAKRWNDVYDQEGNLVESAASDAHMELLSALGRLRLVGGKLHYAPALDVLR